ncbi:P-loop containing nucleoside triphosphate hydrolase protein [Whalleya microplaca]|nr:P-loop containing nucleoside triphosphate hydrolase protein [Whalleya microplaca]
MRSFIRNRPASSSCAVLPHRGLALITHSPFTTSSFCGRAPSKKPNPFTRGHLRSDPLTPPRAAGGRTRQPFDYEGQKQTRKTYDIFRNLVMGRLDVLMNNTRSFKARQEEYKAFGVTSQLDFEREVKLFKLSIDKSCDLASETHAIGKNDNPIFWTLRNAFVMRDVVGLDAELTYSFQNFLMRSRFPKNIEATHRKIADFRFPHEWFPATRAMQRTIHLHVGPTNSGKTYRALKALGEAKSGIYAGPLRLLAHEVYSGFIAKGKKCALITGEEQRVPEDEDNFYRSCTVEMTPLNFPVDVAVIDEIQMIGDEERGWAWTQAVLGVQAKEVHLCGEARAVDIIQSMCATTGDKCVVHRYERLSPLETMTESVGGLENLQKGDAIVSFSRLGIHTLKRQIEKVTGRQCAVVYGSLPPETRAQQAALFNDPDNDYDFLCASDAIGMGLNLEIKRVVFESTHKRDSTQFRQMTTSELKQIGGRAGRYRTARQNMQSRERGEGGEGTGSDEKKTLPPGLVTALEDPDLANVIQAFLTEPEQLQTAGIQPPPAVIERFCSYFPPNTPFSYILSRLRDIAMLSPRYHLCHIKEMLSVADLIQPYPMTVYDRCVFLNAPVALREPNGPKVLQAFARCVSQMDGGNILDIPEIPLEILDIDREEYHLGLSDYLHRLESLHKTITLYLWLSYRYSGVFNNQTLAFHIKELVEKRIDETLNEINFTDTARRSRIKAIRSQARAASRKKKRLFGDDAVADRPPHEGPGDWNEEGHGEPLFDLPEGADSILDKATHGKALSHKHNV